MIIDFKIRLPQCHTEPTLQPETSPGFHDFSQMRRPDSVTRRSLDLLFKEMDSVEISKALVHGRLDADKTGGGNTGEAQHLIRVHPDRLLGTVAIDPNKPDAAMDLIKREVISGAMKAVVIEPGLLPNPWHIDDRRLYPIYDYCARHGVLAIVLSGGEAGPDLSYSNPVLIDHVAMNFPKLRLVSSCGGYPWVRQILHVAFRRRNVYICPDIFLFNMPGWQDYVQAANFYLQDRFLFASGYPLLPVDGCAQAFLSLPFKPEVLPKLLYKNAAGLLNLD